MGFCLKYRKHYVKNFGCITTLSHSIYIENGHIINEQGTRQNDCIAFLSTTNLIVKKTSTMIGVAVSHCHGNCSPYENVIVTL